MTIDKHMSNAAYHHKLHGVSSTMIKLVADKNVGHALWKVNPENATFSDALTKGTAMHSAILTPDLFGLEIIPMIDAKAEGGISNADDAKDWVREHNKTVEKGERLKLTYKTAAELYAAVAAAGGPRMVADVEAEYRAQHVGRTLVPASVYREALEVGEAVRNHPTSAALLTHGEPEVSMWIEQDVTVVTDQGPQVVTLTLKARPDWHDNALRVRVAGEQPKRLIVSVKTAKDASPIGFARQAAALKYHVAEAHYVDVVSKATGTDPDEWMVVWLVVETSGEFTDRVQSIAHYVLSDGELAAGRVVRDKALHAIAVAQLWADVPVMAGYDWQIKDANLPGWIYKGNR